MSFNKKVLILLVAIGLLGVSLKYFPYHCNSRFCTLQKGSGLKTETLKLSGKDIKVEVADTEAARELGLGGRTSLEPDKGMLFVFDHPDKYGFWMKDMKFPIDILWLDEEKVIWIESNVSPNTFPQILYPDSPAKYVLEVPAGYSYESNINIDDSFSLAN